MRLKSDKQKYFIYWVISVSILLILLWVFQIRIDRKNKRLLKQEIDLSNKSNELFRLRDNLRNKQDRLEALSIQLSEKNEKLNELDSREKLEKEYEQIKKEEETLVLRIAERRKDLFLSSAIANNVIKLSKKVFTSCFIRSSSAVRLLFGCAFASMLPSRKTDKSKNCNRLTFILYTFALHQNWK